MEQKKTLWIITAAGVFLAVVVFAALILNKSAPSSVPATASLTTIEKPLVAQFSDEKKSDETESPAILDGSSVENLSDAAETSDVKAMPEEENNGQVTIDLNVSDSSSVTGTNKAGKDAIAAKKQNSKAQTIYTAEPGTVAKAEALAEKKAARLNAASKKQDSGYTPALSKEEVAALRYWVQAASYTSKKTADIARATLDENRIPAEVFTYKDNKDKLYYRVRVGPYTTKSEAEYWKNRINQIPVFKDSKSYITVN